MTTRQKQADIVQDLLNRCNDSKKGYEQAASSASSPSLKLHLHNIALERRDFSQTLSDQISRLGETPSTGGTFKGAAHRTWLNVKAAVSADTEESVLEECLRGDMEFVSDYMDTLESGELSKEIKSTLERQAANVQMRVDRMESMLEKVS